MPCVSIKLISSNMHYSIKNEHIDPNLLFVGLHSQLLYDRKKVENKICEIVLLK